MNQTLKLFTQLPLNKAATELINKLGIRCNPIVGNVAEDDLFKQSDFSFKYFNNVQESIEHIWPIGYIYYDAYNQNIEEVENKYDSLEIYACEIKPEVNFSRSMAANLTRAFNRINTKNFDSHLSIEIPVIVILKQGNLLSIATCERNERKDGTGDKIGKVTMLRNMNCDKLHPGHRQILERIANEVSSCSRYDELYQRWFKSFSIDILSDEFFRGYKAIYEDITEYVTGKRMVKEDGKWVEREKKEPCLEIMSEFAEFENPEKAVRDYVKKLMGRLVFIQFLQKKGWMGVPDGEEWGEGKSEFLQHLFEKSDKKETFVDDVLEPLFDDLNTKRDKDLVTNQNIKVDNVDIKVPYLNGGLFEPDKSDELSFQIPSHFIKKLLDFFASYNFTIDENAPDNVEVGVDPEMLGRIFENLLEDNKDKGAFYTPKEIVQHMCRESLIAYLMTDEADDLKSKIRDFVTTHDVSVLSSDLSKTIDKRLKDVKICDPAIGSGAFPMGMLHELYTCRKAIEGIDDETAVRIKSEIIQNNIYGVDIEKGAVDIARLRFWLALIVDEKSPHALPNMDFKIMQGNSLLEQYEGVELSGMSLNEKKRHKTKKGKAWQPTFAFDEKTALENIQNAIREYYGTDDHCKKVELRDIINSNVKSYILNLKGCTPDIQKKLESLPIPNNKFFLWHIYFKEVFDNGGFDIVIGNPPYIDSETMVRIMPTERNLYADIFSCASGNWDMFIIFIELSISLLKVKGVFSNIIPNKLIAAKYGVELRKLLSNQHIIEIRDYSRIDVFEDAAVYPITIVLHKKEEIGDTLFVIMENRIDIKQSNITKSTNLSKNNYWDPFFTETPIFNLITKINSFNTLNNLPVQVLGAATVAEAYEIIN